MRSRTIKLVDNLEMLNLNSLALEKIDLTKIFTVLGCFFFLGGVGLD